MLSDEDFFLDKVPTSSFALNPLANLFLVLPAQLLKMTEFPDILAIKYQTNTLKKR